MNKSLIFFSGLVLGFLLATGFNQNQDEVAVNKSKNQENNTKSIISKKNNSPLIAEPIKKNIETVVNKQINPEVVANMEMISKTSSVPEQLEIKRKIKVTLSEEDVVELENQWSELAYQVQVKREHRGWRVLHLENQSVLSRAGLNEGNLITYEFIQGMNNENELPRRIARILDYVSR